MKHQEVEARGLIERYLQRRLDAEDLERFENHYFDCPECLEQLELAETLQEGIRHTAASEAGRFLAPRRESSAPRARWMQPAAAALFAVGLTATLFLVDVPSGDDPGAGGAPVVNTPVFFLGAERSAGGTEPTTRIRPRAGLGAFVLALEIEDPGEAERFRASLTSYASPDAPLWSGEDLRIDHNGTVSLSLPADFLPPGIYRLSMVPVGTDGPSREFAFQILESAETVR